MARSLPRKRRKIEAHRLKISGLTENSTYSEFLVFVRTLVPNNRAASHLIGGKTHVLSSLEVVNNRLRFLFFSFAGQDRPDVLDMEDYSIGTSPLDDNQTGVYWTHVIGGESEDEYLLAIEKHQAGIWPSSVEQYLQWLIDRYAYQSERMGAFWTGRERITVSMEPVPGDEFLNRLHSLDRITKATVRIVKPNPGWADLDRELGREASESDAHKVDVAMTARRNESLSKEDGIVAAIEEMAENNTLGFASIEGKERGEQQPTVSFNTEKLGKQTHASMRVDAHGQVEHQSAWSALDEAFRYFGE